jgi:hypothetical protein
MVCYILYRIWGSHSNSYKKFLYCPVKVNWQFGGMCNLHLQGWRISQARHQHEAGSKQSLYQLTFNVLHDIIFQKINSLLYFSFQLQSPWFYTSIFNSSVHVFANINLILTKCPFQILHSLNSLYIIKYVSDQDIFQIKIININMSKHKHIVPCTILCPCRPHRKHCSSVACAIIMLMSCLLYHNLVMAVSSVIMS